MKLRLFLISSLSLLLCSTGSWARVITEDKLDFTLKKSALEKGDIQIVVQQHNLKDFFSENPLYRALDVGGVQELTQHQIIAGKSAFIIPKGHGQLSKEKIHTSEGFASLSRNVTVSHETKIDNNTIGFDLRKRVMSYSVTSKVKYSYYQEDEFNKSAKIKAIVEANEDGLKTKFITIHNTYDFSGHFHDAINVCYYEDYDVNETLVVCHILTSVQNSSLRLLGILVNFKQQLKSEVLYTVKHLQQMNSGEGGGERDDGDGDDDDTKDSDFTSSGI